MPSELEPKIHAGSPRLLQIIAEVADRLRRPMRASELQVRLHFPLIADASERATESDLHSLGDDVLRDVPSTIEWPQFNGLSLHDTRFGVVAESEAARVMRDYHYLRSPRLEGRHYGLWSRRGELMALGVTSPLDVEHIERLVASHSGRPARTRVLSRVFCFPGTPRNSISRLLSRMAREELGQGTSDLVTYADPNMGFDGVSYRASGWQQIGVEPGTTYRYLDRRYVTERALVARFRTADTDALTIRLGARFAISAMRLLPLLVFHRRLGKR